MPETVREYFNRTAQAFASNYSDAPDFKERLRVWQRAIEKNIADITGRSVCLDMGCGDGSICRQVAVRGIRTIGFDQSETMLVLARRRAAEYGVVPQTEYVRASIPLEKELAGIYRDAAGLMICSSVLEYVSDYEEALRQFYSLLEPGGILLLSLPNRLSTYRIFERTLRRHIVRRDSYLRHQRHQFDSHEVRSLMTAIGFRTIDVEFFSLPLQSVTEKIVGSYRGRWLATMFLVTAQKL